MSKIRRAAVRWTDPESHQTHVETSFGHTECYEQVNFVHNIYLLSDPFRYQCEEGFVLDDDTFVTRQEAFKIAKENNQLDTAYKHYTDVFNNGLKSYMMDWSTVTR